MHSVFLFSFFFFFSLLACCRLRLLGPEPGEKVVLFFCFLTFMPPGAARPRPSVEAVTQRLSRLPCAGASSLAPSSRLTHPLSAGLFGFSPTIFPALTECGGYQNGFQTPEEKVYAGSAQKKEAGDMPPPLYAIN